MPHILQSLIQAALQAVDAERAVRRILKLQGERLVIDASLSLDLGNYRRIYLLGVGKASAAMAAAAERILGSRLESGYVVVKRGHGCPLQRCHLVEAGHPEPDEGGLQAAQGALEFLEANLQQDDLLLMLISGGGSALLPLPCPPLTLQDKQQATRLLLRSGASIHEMNMLRKHLSAFKGGRLVEHTRGCRIVTLLISDVIGDDSSVIASGLTAPDASTFADCLDILDRRGLRDRIPPRVAEHLLQGACETPKPGDPLFERVSNRVIATNRQALQAAAQKARQQGLAPLILSSTIQGSTREAARLHVALAREALDSGNPLQPPCCLISGGETTVEVKGDGLGGRNQEFALWCARDTQDWREKDVIFASLGSDGNDGPTPAAGAWATPETARKAAEMGLSCRDFLRRNDSHRFFKEMDQLIVTGPTRTNVMDLRFVILPKRLERFRAKTQSRKEDADGWTPEES